MHLTHTHRQTDRHTDTHTQTRAEPNLTLDFNNAATELRTCQMDKVLADDHEAGRLLRGYTRNEIHFISLTKFEGRSNECLLTFTTLDHQFSGHQYSQSPGPSRRYNSVWHQGAVSYTPSLLIRSHSSRCLLAVGGYSLMDLESKQEVLDPPWSTTEENCSHLNQSQYHAGCHSKWALEHYSSHNLPYPIYNRWVGPRDPIT